MQMIEKIKQAMPQADIVIVDHHIINPDQFSSNANVVVNPRLNDSTPYCTGGLVYQLARQCAKTCQSVRQIRYLPYAAIATIADVCTMTGSNRIIVKNGLDALKMCEDKGISALFKVAEIDRSRCNTENISFGIGPMINASGRVRVASKAFLLLRKQDPDKAMELAKELRQFNEESKEIQKTIAEEAIAKFEKERGSRNCALLYSDQWNPGIVGIVASKIVDKHKVPTICFGCN
jgi:single-stranded-DNA-specific exonuclease